MLEVARLEETEINIVKDGEERVQALYFKRKLRSTRCLSHRTLRKGKDDPRNKTIGPDPHRDGLSSHRRLWNYRGYLDGCATWFRDDEAMDKAFSRPYISLQVVYERDSNKALVDGGDTRCHHHHFRPAIYFH